MKRDFRKAGPLAVAAFVVAAGLTILLAVYPLLALLREGITVDSSAAATLGFEHPFLTFATSIAWALGAAVVGTIAAWPASRAFRRRGGAGLPLLAALLVTFPLALPPWLLYAAMWMSVGPGTAIGDWAERGDLMGWLRMAILSAALVAWCAALAFAVLSATAPRAMSADERLLSIDGASPPARMRAMLARDARSLLVAVFGAAAFLLCETTVYDLAQVSTFGFELRTLDALGAPAGAVVAAALPAIVLAIAAAACMPLAARAVGDAALRARGADSDSPVLSVRRPAWRVGASAVALVAAALPSACILVILLRVEASVPRAADFLPLHGRALAVTCATSLAVGVVVGLLAAALRVLLDARHSAGAGASARTMAFLLLALGLAPATLTALAVESAYNSNMLAPLYDSPAVLVVVLAARAAPLAAIAALVFAAREPASAARLRAVDGVSWLAAWRGLRHELAVVAIGAGTLGFTWSLGELTASGRVVPPGVQWIATDVLNAIHYQRPDTVVLATLALLLAALPAVLALLRGIRRLQGQMVMLVLCGLLSAGLLPGCGGSSDGADGAGDPDDRLMAALRAASPEVKDPLAVSMEFVGVGRGRGQFNGPRVLAVDRTSGDTYVIDKDARVQRFDRAGAVLAEWRMPKWDRGKPVGASVAPDGSLVVADTHEHRVVAYSPTGETRWTLGEYGTGPGQFIYPTDVVFLADGRILVAEYGGNDRIQAFGPDRRVMYQFGAAGTNPGEFLRPQAMTYDAERDELYVIDSGNHRVQVFTADGELRRTIGRMGLASGELNYPFGITLLIGGRATDAFGQAGDGDHSAARRTIVVAEHGNHRVQILDGQSGESLAIAGGIGRERGRVKYPWAIEPAGVADDGSQRFALCDLGNSRIVFFTLPVGP
ncbi:MAG: hypothetical protein RLZZ116_186 [Planctomycetota bacterium]|jgi:hypothetical protein